MVKNVTELNLERQKKRAAIQMYFQNNPDSSDSKAAKYFGVSRRTVSKWKNQKFFTDKIRNRKTKMTQEIKRFLISKAKNKYTGIEGASSRKLALDIKNKFSLNISKTTINKWLNKLLEKPIKAKKTFLLREKDKKKRVEFSNLIIEKNITGKSIFFTDEKRFLLNAPLNRQTNQLRTNKEGKKEYKTGMGPLFEKIARPQPKFQKGIMVAGGLSYKGVSKLIFITGTMTSFSYEQALKLYKEDIERLDPRLHFQQDNAPCHTSKTCLNFINSNFRNKLEFWPPNSPDLSPIEELWALVEEKLSKYSYSNTNELVKRLQWIWNRIPKNLCRHLIMSFDKKIQKIKENGERANKRDHTNYESIGEWTNNWNKDWINKDSVERIIYNQKVLENMKNKKIKELKNNIKSLKKDLNVEKRYYCLENKNKIKKESKELYEFFLEEEKKMIDSFNTRILEKENDIKRFREKNGKELFELFNEEEKINSICFGKKGKKSKTSHLNSTNDN